MLRLREVHVRSAHLVLQRSMARPRKGVLRAVPLLVCERHGALEGLLLAVRRAIGILGHGGCSVGRAVTQEQAAQQSEAMYLVKLQ